MQQVCPFGQQWGPLPQHSTPAGQQRPVLGSQQRASAVAARIPKMALAIEPPISRSALRRGWGLASARDRSSNHSPMRATFVEPAPLFDSGRFARQRLGCRHEQRTSVARCQGSFHL